MEFMILFGVIAGLIVLDVLAMRYGADSRDTIAAPPQGILQAFR